MLFKHVKIHFGSAEEGGGAVGAFKGVLFTQVGSPNVAAEEDFVCKAGGALGT